VLAAFIRWEKKGEKRWDSGITPRGPSGGCQNLGLGTEKGANRGVSGGGKTSRVRDLIIEQRVWGLVRNLSTEAGAR